MGNRYINFLFGGLLMSKSKKRRVNYEDQNPEIFYSQYRSKSNNTGNILGIDFSKNPEQRELIRLMNENNSPVIYCFGNAGTGKTFCTIAAAVDLVKIQKKYSKIFYIREPIEVGHSLGYVPGDVSEKYGVYLGGLYDNLDSINRFSGISPRDMLMSIECIPPQYTRGRSFPKGSIIIIDEAQNLSLTTLQTLLTRFSKFSKVVLLGSFNQIDIKNKTEENNDFLTSYKILSNIDDDNFVVKSVTLVKPERSDYCALIDDAITKYKSEKGL